MEANQDRQRLAAVLRTLADVLESEAEIKDLLSRVFDASLQHLRGSLSDGAWRKIRACDLRVAEHYAANAAKLAGVEVAKAVGDE